MTCAVWSKHYDSMLYNRCGQRGLKLAAVLSSLWQNFGHAGDFPTSYIEKIQSLEATERR